MHKQGGSGTQERTRALEPVANAAHDTFLPASSNIITTGLQSSNDKQNFHNLPSKTKDFNMALKLFPEFHLQDTHKKEWNQPLYVTTKGTIHAVIGSPSNSEADSNIAEHLKNSKEIVDWFKNEYGMKF